MDSLDLNSTSISLILESFALDFCAFLDPHSIIEASICNHFYQKVTTFHIQNNFTFCVPFFAIQSKSPQEFLKVYKYSKKISNYWGNYLNIRFITNNNSHVILPSGTTHYRGSSSIELNFPPSLTHLYIHLRGHRFDIPPVAHLTIYGSVEIRQLLDSKLRYTLKFLHFCSPLKITSSTSSTKDLTPNFTQLTHFISDCTDSWVPDLPPSLKVLKLPIYFNETIKWNFPLLTHLIVGNDFNQKIDEFPPNLTHLHIGPKFNHIIGNLPSNLKYLKFGGDFEQSIHELPPYLEYLQFRGAHANSFQIYVDNLPQTLKHVVFTGWCGSIDHLPPLLKTLRFTAIDYGLSLAMDNLPVTLQILHLPPIFNKAVDYFPMSLATINFGKKFNQNVDHLPKYVTHITFGYHFNKPIDFLPEFLTHLTLGFSFNQNIYYLPSTLICLNIKYQNFNHHMDYLPSSLKNLAFCTDVDSETIGFDLQLDNLPLSLTKVEFGTRFNQNVDNLPSSLKFISFSYHFDKPVDHLPPFLAELSFAGRFNHPIDFLPKSLINLSISGHFNQSLEMLPDSLRSLFIGGSFAQKITHFSPHLRKLNLRVFTKMLEFDVHLLPSTLTHFEAFAPPMEALPNLITLL